MNGLIANLILKNKAAQENAVRVLAAMTTSREKIDRLCKVKMIVKALAKTVETGTIKARDTAIWLLWLLTEEDGTAEHRPVSCFFKFPRSNLRCCETDCCNKLGSLENTINDFIDIAATHPEDEEHCNTRGNALVCREQWCNLRYCIFTCSIFSDGRQY